MAGNAVSFALDKLVPLIRDEANLLFGIRKEFADIRKELEYIQGSIDNAEEAAGTNKVLKTWVEDLKEASFRIEDVIDEYTVLVEQQPHDPGCAALLCQIIQTLMPRHRIASEIQQIKSFVQGIKQREKDYHYLIQPYLNQRPSSYRGSKSVEWHDPRMHSRYLDEAEVVGLEDPRDELIGWLVDGPAERTVISVVGMGGLGKTTLAGRVFNNQRVIAHFDYHAWITVSQSYTVEGLLRELLKKLRRKKRVDPPVEGISEMDRDSLIDEVRSHLQQERYFVIFDDVWSVELWGQIKNVMLDNKNGSRILITTRSKNVVESCKNSPFDRLHELKHLTFEKSMELFCKKAFRFHNNGRCPDHLMNISCEIVAKCGGLPLAIVAICDLLSGKVKITLEWEKLNRNLCLEMEKNPQLIGIRKILGFSTYDDLPYYLQSCFLYIGIYPIDYQVKSTRLIRQWIAEGFVKDEKGKTLEEVARQYLTELIDRSLVQVSSFTIDGKARSCQVHTMLHELILRKSKESSFCQHISKEDDSMPSGMVRRLSIATNSNDFMKSTKSSHILSLLFFTGKHSASTDNFVQSIPTKFRLLKVLDFEDGQLHFVPENLGNLVHLKYLSLRDTQMQYLPRSIGKLQNLETLDIRDTAVREMPKEICELRKLQHLLGDDMELFELKNGLGRMTSLQTLCRVKLSMDDDDGAALIRELEKLKQLRNLGLTGVKEEQGRALCSSINEMKNLEKLYIDSKSQYEVIDLPDISPLHKLRKHSLVGKLNKFPKWVPQLQYLVKLTLHFSKLIDDPLISLQDMPNLLFLVISHNAYEGESLHFQDGGFQQLRKLHLKYLSNLNSIIIDKGALHSLKKLKFGGISKLWTVPPGIQHLEKLEVLFISHMSTEFYQGFAANGKLNHPIIKHVPLVRIDYHTFRHSRH